MYRKLNRQVCPAEKRNSEVGNYPAGFTLTEVLVASTLLVIAIVPILRALTISHLNTGFIERKTRSLALARGKLEEIKAKSIYSYSSGFSENSTSLDGSYLCNVADVSAGTNLRTITVSVGYDSNGNGNLAADEIEVAMATRLAKRW